MDTKPLWWQQGVVYQIYPRSFRDTNADGVGDLAGVIEKLDYLSGTLGVDAIWLSPFYPSPMADFGYDVSDYTDVDPLFGDLDTFDELVSQAHERDIKVIIDYVPNHTSDQHPWFIESRSSRDNPKRDWYVWADPKPDGSPPNNWLSAFGGSAWEWDERTGQYYLHIFLKEQPDLNWYNPEVRKAMYDVLRFWLDRGVDGFRIDAAHYITHDPELRDNPPNVDASVSSHKPLGEYDQQIHIYDRAHPAGHEVFREIRQVLDEYSAERPRVAVGELHIYEWDRWATYYGAELDEIHLPFNFGLLHTEWEPRAIGDLVNTIESVIPPGAWPNYVLSNHDEPRIATRVGRAHARIAMMLLLTLRGTPTLYNGDELGMEDVPIPPGEEQDPWGKQMPGLGLGRDPQRAPMLWDASPNAGFCPPDVKPWLPIHPNHERICVATQLQDPTSMLSMTRRLLAVRRASEALHSGSYSPLTCNDETCLAYLRQSGEEQIAVVLNFSSEDRTLRLDLPGSGAVLVSTHMDREGVVNLSALELRGDEGCVIRLTG